MRLRETLPMALEAIRANKLRSVLTLVGIVAGVASIIAVMTGISVIQSTMESELSVLGTQTFQVQKWPAGGLRTGQPRLAEDPGAATGHRRGRGGDPRKGEERRPRRRRALAFRRRGELPGREDRMPTSGWSAATRSTRRTTRTSSAWGAT